MDILNQIPIIGNPLLTILATIIALSIIVAVHEYGHYIVGRWSGIHAEAFSIGFGPTLFKRVDKRGTEWKISAIPLGGYVKFLGDANAASAGKDEGFLDQIVHEEREKELRRSMFGAPLWARALTVAAGPIFNFIMGALIFAATSIIIGTATEPPTIGKMLSLPPNVENQLQQGDTILAIEGQKTPDYETLLNVINDLTPKQSLEYDVLRNGEELNVNAPWPAPIHISALTPGGAGINAGLKLGDVITSIDGEPVFAFSQILELTKVWPEGKQVLLEVWRDGESLEFELEPIATDLPLGDGTFENRRIVGFSSSVIMFEPATGPTGVGTALKNGAESVYQIMRQSLSAFYNVVTGQISKCAIRGAVGIAEAAGDMASQGAGPFIRFIGMLSVAVGLVNLFPVPVLDGGHLVFHAYEAVFRRPPSELALKVLMTIGFTVIIAFMAFALINDFICP